MRFSTNSSLVCVIPALLSLIAGASNAELLSRDDPRIVDFENAVIARMERADDNAPRHSIEERLDIHGVPGAGVAIIENGGVVWATGYGVKLAGTDDAVDADTVFSVGSVSKVVNAALILRLVSEGLVDLDEDVNVYLKSWKVPESSARSGRKVTLRSILSHTAGFNVHGFRDYQPGQALPGTLQIITGEPPAMNEPIKIVLLPGERMQYSGGGVTVSQMLVEDMTGLTYPQAAKKYVFDPLGMDRSTFENPLPASHGNIARAHGEGGVPAALPRGWEAMPEMAASGLWTSAADLGKFVLALLGAESGSAEFLPAELREDMLTRVPQSWHGLGPRLNGNGETRVFHHGGANDSYRAWIEGHPGTQSGIIVLTNGRDGHWIHSELRKSAEDAFDWAVESDGGFEEPEF